MAITISEEAIAVRVGCFVGASVCGCEKLKTQKCFVTNVACLTSVESLVALAANDQQGSCPLQTLHLTLTQQTLSNCSASVVAQHLTGESYL